MQFLNVYHLEFSKYCNFLSHKLLPAYITAYELDTKSILYEQNNRKLKQYNEYRYDVKIN